MKTGIKRAALGLVVTAGLLGVGYYSYQYWIVGRFLETTNNAYVQADYTTVAPKVSGYIAEVLVQDNQPVKAGQVLARIDDRDFQNLLAQAEADVANAQGEIRSFDAQIAMQQSVIAQAEATIAAGEAGVRFSKQDADRHRSLIKSGAVTVRSAEMADADFRQKTAFLERDRAALVSARQRILVLQTERAKAETQLQRNEAVKQQAKLNLSYTTITSSIDGIVGARSVRIGQFVQSGTPLMAVVPLHAVYIVANLKETQLTYIRNGQRAQVAIDTFPGVEIKGHVDSLAPASGLQFALLPPDNATGNFTKIVQRVPVKIVLDQNNSLAGLLRPGMSVEVSIDIKATVIAEQANDTLVANANSERQTALQLATK
jgi:membrane fusion protein (multidrug efflux system)